MTSVEIISIGARGLRVGLRDARSVARAQRLCEYFELFKRTFMLTGMAGRIAAKGRLPSRGKTHGRVRLQPGDAVDCELRDQESLPVAGPISATAAWSVRWCGMVARLVADRAREPGERSFGRLAVLAWIDGQEPALSRIAALLSDRPIRAGSKPSIPASVCRVSYRTRTPRAQHNAHQTTGAASLCAGDPD